MFHVNSCAAVLEPAKAKIWFHRFSALEEASMQAVPYCAASSISVMDLDASQQSDHPRKQ